jgi:hypothetical protein
MHNVQFSYQHWLVVGVSFQLTQLIFWSRHYLNDAGFNKVFSAISSNVFVEHSIDDPAFAL